MASSSCKVFLFIFHIRPIYPHSYFPVILKYLLNSTYIISNPRTNASVIVIYLMKTSPKCGSKEGPPWRKGLPDKWFIRYRGGFFKMSFSFWKLGNWFSCLLKHHHKTRSWRAELTMVEIFNEPGKSDPRGLRSEKEVHSSRLTFSFPASWRAEAAF